MRLTVFISHHHGQANVVALVAEQLESVGITAWYAPRDVPFGDDWPYKVADAIRRSDCLLLLFDQQADDSREVLRELVIADRNDIPVLWIRRERTDPRRLEYHLATSQAIDWLDDGTPIPGEVVQRLRTLQAKGRETNGALARLSGPGAGAGPSKPMDGYSARSEGSAKWDALDLLSLIGSASEFREWAESLSVFPEYAQLLLSIKDPESQHRTALRLGWLYRRVDWTVCLRLCAYAHALRPTLFTAGAIQECLWHEGRYAEALSVSFNNPLGTPQEARALAMADALLGKGHWQLAHAAYESLLSGRRRRQAALGVAKCLEMEGRILEAIAAYEQIAAQGKKGTVGEAKRAIARLTNPKSRSRLKISPVEPAWDWSVAISGEPVDPTVQGLNLYDFLDNLDQVQRRCIPIAAFIATEILYAGPNLNRVGYPLPEAFPEYLLAEAANVPVALVSQLLPVHSKNFHAFLRSLNEDREFAISRNEVDLICLAFVRQIHSRRDWGPSPFMALREDCFNMATVVQRQHPWLSSVADEARHLLSVSEGHYAGARSGNEAIEALRQAISPQTIQQR